MKLKIILLSLVVLVLLGIGNAYFLAPQVNGDGQVVAYRGGGSQVDYEKLSDTSCTAKSLSEVGLTTVENTLQAASASVAAGADIIHLNVHLINDNELVVFHDWNLSCATNENRLVSDLNVDQLQSIDAGYGYTADYGRTFPFRGKGFRIDRLDAFYERFPNQTFWLNLKTNNEDAFLTLSRFISEKNNKTVVITSAKGNEWFANETPSLQTFSVNTVKNCGTDYLLVGWAGVIPDSCKNTVVLVPPDMAKFIWGYPDRLAARLAQHNTQIYLWNKHDIVPPEQANIIKQGVGVVTGNIDFIESVK